VDDAGPPALLGRPRHLPVEGPVDLEGAEAGPVVADLGEGPGRERLRPGQPDQRPDVQGAQDRPAGAERLAAGLNGHRPTPIDHDPVDPAAGQDLDPVPARHGLKAGGDHAGAALHHGHAEALTEHGQQQGVDAGARLLGLEVGVHGRAGQERLGLLGLEALGDRADPRDDQAGELEPARQPQPPHHLGQLLERPALHLGPEERLHDLAEGLVEGEPGRPVAQVHLVDRGRGLDRRAAEGDRLVAGERVGGRHLGVHEPHAVGGQVAADDRRGRRDQGEEGGPEVVLEPRQG
jgi:hypothetical protein